MADKLISAKDLMADIEEQLRYHRSDDIIPVEVIDMIKYAIEEAPAVDAAPIVLCKDCEYATINEVNNTLVCCDYFDPCGYVGKECDDNGCTYGRKK